jgi:putative transcriptional regulator
MISPESIDLATLPSIPLESKSQLPKKPGIYLAIDSGGIVQYVGRSINFRQRWAKHHRHRELEKLEGIRIAWLEVNDPSLLPNIESVFITWFNPPLNKVNVLHKSNLHPQSLRATRSSNLTVPARRMMCRLAVLMAEKDPRLSQRKLAEELGLAVTTVSRLHNNDFERIDKATVKKLCGYFGCSINDLFVLRNSNLDETKLPTEQKVETHPNLFLMSPSKGNDNPYQFDWEADVNGDEESDRP